LHCSVILPTYNREESLTRTLNALTRQTLSNAEFEVVAVSDGSTDGTELVLSEFSTSKRLVLKWFSQNNAGPSAARNFGVKMARGEILVFVDDDVEPVPHFLERHLSHHSADERVVVIGPLSPDPRWVKEEPAWIAWEHAKLAETYKLFRPGGKLSDREPGCEHFYSGNASVRRKWIEEVGGFNAKYKRQEDVELATRLSDYCGVHFVFDFQADGLHHPSRSLASWLELPIAYGGLDSERVRSGSLAAADVERNLCRRHGMTRLLTHLFLTSASDIDPTSRALCSIATALYSSGMSTWALNLLSAVYNARYTVAYRRARKTSAMTSKAAAY
jgi:glycosyltransferase involved in cell wall biosynthesis